jgi:ketosteroid isomerase-like protein
VGDELLERFRAVYARFGDFSPQTLTELYAEDLVIEQTPDLPGTAGTFHGYEGLRALQDELNESYTDILWRPEEVLVAGDSRYLVRVLVTAHGTGSGVPMSAEIAHLVTLDERGRLSHIRTFLTWERGREAASIPPE